MNPEERAQIRLEEDLQNRGILESTACKGAILFGTAFGILGAVGGCEDTAKFLNSMPPDLLGEAIRREVMYILENTESFREMDSRLMNASIVAIAGSAIGTVLGGIIDLIGKVRSRLDIACIDKK